ncbi:ribonuclease R [Maridesulfovibrio salexigens]|uniref:Ribonuclease R n=1 Tax=Maridesulfovibrio salexigens (strain ATCC 14822 / DSM 2638 / NCIMB 8403 / VKM B-1763) TaxID=526222 RepID=C6C1J0_MARSD|nr:ribonuclease R [Maridesulfovibrio salexigens]ACS81165.1 ribonuclease R [Maridesulfovibrio salexigens DSM 2638]
MGKKRKSKNPGMIKPYEAMNVFKQSRKPLSVGELEKRVGLTKRHRKFVKNILKDLVREGKIIKIGSAYGVVEKMNLVTGKLQVQRSGAAFLLPDDKKRKDIYIHTKNLRDAWHGDRVTVAITGSHWGGKREEGRVVRVLERGKQVFPVRVIRPMGGTALLCHPTDPRLDFGIVVEPDEAVVNEPVLDDNGREIYPAESVDAEVDFTRVSRGDILLVAPGEQINPSLWEGRILKMLGDEDDAIVQEAIVKANHGIPTAFPGKVLAVADALPDEPVEEDFADREDMRDIPFVTIDGATAKDFDDAVFVEKIAGGYRLRVAIADVSHYVAMESPLDREALKRGNSYYFPKSVEPMFPEALSNGLCSLNPDVNRLAMTATIEFDKSGAPVNSSFAPAVIRSQGRLTYEQVYQGVILGEKEEQESLGDLLPMLKLCEELARKINKRRNARGSLEFDLPEPEILFNLQGRTVDIRPRCRNFAHQIVEEFMIAANEAVAEFLTEKEIGCLYRVHPGPDEEKLTNLFKVLRKIGISKQIPDPVTPQTLQEVIKDSEGTDQEYIVSRLLLRSMKQAKYEPDNEGHFGLASECYCHFTSPIRRYADLVVHRLLKVALGDEHQAIPGQKQLGRIGSAISGTERTAMEAEREILKRLTIIFLKDKVGEEFTGVISSIAEFGFWVEFQEVMAEGMVRLSSLGDDYYTFWSDRQMIVGERTGHAFRLGQKITVRLESVSLELLEANLSLVSGAEDYKKFV